MKRVDLLKRIEELEKSHDPNIPSMFVFLETEELTQKELPKRSWETDEEYRRRFVSGGGVVIELRPQGVGKPCLRLRFSREYPEGKSDEYGQSN